jgi:hypothetical protein
MSSDTSRQKRKRRPGAHATAHAPAAADAPPPSRSERRNEQARAALEPLEPGERPPAVTVAAIVALALALGNLAAYAAGFKIGGTRPPLGTVAAQAALMLAAAWGMWRARYWAVLGMQAILALLIVIVSVSALKASTALDLVVVAAIIVPAGTLFWKLVKAMARIQMPERR